jgi:hypothetical protein
MNDPTKSENKNLKSINLPWNQSKSIFHHRASYNWVPDVLQLSTDDKIDDFLELKGHPGC